MTKNILLFILFLGMMGCATNNITVNYFGQPEPGATPVIFGEGSISQKGRFEHGISFTPNINELAFGILNKDGVSGAIHYSRKVNKKWTVPEAFEPLENKSVFLPYFTPDRKSLLYAQSEPDDVNGATNIWKIEKSNGIWDSPKKIQAPVNSVSREANACMTSDGTIYFSSNRNCLGKEDCYTADLFYSKLMDDEYQSAQEISKFKSSNDEESVFISPKEEYILFCRFTDNESWMDLYISYRDHNNNWTEPQILDATINSKDWDRRPFISIDNKFLFFTRLQIGEKGLTESDIYWVNTSKVFKPFVYNPLSNMVVQVGDKFELPIPSDYFKDIDDEQLTLSSNENEFDWLEFDTNKMKLSGLPTRTGDFELIFTAVDKFSNKTLDKVTLTVNR
ncbi:putative Ig domain-containing protein [Maribacter sp. 2210JD10-5]|uniref:putative Ig domain-containing protein n=1 Tax=Maribacter sp. 2210JD10-5 TaxID=3386272 RepID=UPI0039BD66B3